MNFSLFLRELIRAGSHIARIYRNSTPILIKMSSIGSVSDGRIEMPTISKSRTTIRNASAKGRLPKNRPPMHPGEMLLEEFLKPLGISQVDFAARLGVSFPRLNEIIKKRRGVTPDTALRLGRVLGMSADFWLGLQLDWDLWNAMQGADYPKIEQLKPVTF